VEIETTQSLDAPREMRQREADRTSSPGSDDPADLPLDRRMMRLVSNVKDNEGALPLPLEKRAGWGAGLRSLVRPAPPHRFARTRFASPRANLPLPAGESEENPAEQTDSIKNIIL